MIHITELEAELLLEIACSDFSSDGYGFSWCYRPTSGYDKAWMAKMRGCMASLKAKGVINISVDYDAWDGKTTWVGIYGDYLRDATDEEKAVKDSIASWTGKCYANLDRTICPTEASNCDTCGEVGSLNEYGECPPCVEQREYEDDKFPTTEKPIYGQPVIGIENKENDEQ